jgi:hypothetical protein
MTLIAEIRPLHIALLVGLTASGPIFAQSRSEPLGDILESIEETTEPEPAPAPMPIPNAPVPPDGIGTTPLPPSRFDAPYGEPATPADEGEVPPDGVGTRPLPPLRGPVPFGPPTPPPAEESEADEADPVIDDLSFETEEDPTVPPELTEAELQAQWEAAERARLEALDRARAEREAARERARAEAQAEYEQRIAEREAAIAEAEAAYQAQIERTMREAERNHALWLERVRACREGYREACAQPSDYNY